VGRLLAGATVGVAERAPREAETKALGAKVGEALAALGIG
jgi:hypothetical protein